MSTTTEELLDLGQALSYTQGIRKRVVESFIGEGQVPKDKDDLNLLLRTLNDIDNTSIQRTKLNLEKEAGDTSKLVAESMVKLIEMQQNRNPFQRNPDGSVNLPPPPSADLEKLGKFEIQPGEMEIGIITETAAEFMARVESDPSITGVEPD